METRRASKRSTSRKGAGKRVASAIFDETPSKFKGQGSSKKLIQSEKDSQPKESKAKRGKALSNGTSSSKEVEKDTPAIEDGEEVVREDADEIQAEDDGVAEKTGDDNGDVDRLYNVEQILSRRIVKQGKKKVTQYLIRWEGYGKNSDSWEPEEGLPCFELLEKFNTAYDENTGSSNEAEAELLDTVYVVEKILDMRKKRGRRQRTEYLVQWKEYPGEDSWETEVNAPDLIAEFMSERAKSTVAKSARQNQEKSLDTLISVGSSTVATANGITQQVQVQVQSQVIKENVILLPVAIPTEVPMEVLSEVVPAQGEVPTEVPMGAPSGVVPARVEVPTEVPMETPSGVDPPGGHRQHIRSWLYDNFQKDNGAVRAVEMREFYAKFCSSQEPAILLPKGLDSQFGIQVTHCFGMGTSGGGGNSLPANRVRHYKGLGLTEEGKKIYKNLGNSLSKVMF